MINGMKQFYRLREKYKEFIYSGYEYSESEASIDIIYHFKIPGLAEFHPTWTIGKLTLHSSGEDAVIDDLVFSLGMVELVSYWKLTCSPQVLIKDKILVGEQISWWKKLYFKGLGEFFYTNGIIADEDFMNIQCLTSKTLVINQRRNQKKEALIDEMEIVKFLIPVGGGKDSAVTIDLLLDKGDCYCFMINPRQAVYDTVAVSGLLNKSIIAWRKLDSNMIELNKKGFFNGHTPFSAIVAFSSVLTAYVNGIKYVALSNESSANEATVENTDINHQYSKSYEFESDFRYYDALYINTEVQYFSLLRPLMEIQIARLFASLKQYHSVFKSCNVGSKSDIWCGSCSKCLFVYIILAPFLDEETMINIFGKNMLNGVNLIASFEKLVGLQPEKPFECVGSRFEVQEAILMTIQKYYYENKNIPFLLQYFMSKFGEALQRKTKLFEYWDEQNFIPEFIQTSIRERIFDRED